MNENQLYKNIIERSEKKLSRWDKVCILFLIIGALYFVGRTLNII